MTHSVNNAYRTPNGANMPTITSLTTSRTDQKDNLCRLEILPNEFWWGGAVNDGVKMPFGPSYNRDLRRDHGGNQASPLLLSSYGRYIWSNEPFAVCIEDEGDRLNIELEGSHFISGQGCDNLAGAFRAASARFFPASGQMPDPLNFSAPQYNSWIEMQYEPTQEKILRYAREILENGLPPGVLMIDDNWFEDHGNWRFDPLRFPDPAEMVRSLHADGFAVVLWVSPFISPDSAVFRSLSARNLLVRNAEGTSAVREWWNGHSALLDVTHPDGIAWMHMQLDSLTAAFGIDGYKFDAGDPEFVKPSDITYGSVSPSGYCQAWAEIGLQYSRFNEYRACWKLGGQPLVQRLRDKLHAWGTNGLADIIPNGIAHGLAGYSFICPDMVGGGDIGSFTDPEFLFDQELFVRTLQCSILFPIVQFSLAPWRVLDATHWNYCQDAIRTRRNLTGRILDLAASSASTGEPIVRHMAYVFPDAGLEQVKDQFMLGDRILVAPVTAQGALSRTVRFPSGTWTGTDGDTVVGPCSRDVPAPFSSLPWYVAN